MDNPKISVIVPVYNIEKYLEHTLISLVKQTYDNLEIILVDDGSTDESGKICDRFAGKFKNIKVIHQKNRGVCAARNKGIEVASGEYIGFCDGDDDVCPDLYEFLYVNLKENQADISLCGEYIVQPNKTKVKRFTMKKEIWTDNREFLKDFFSEKITMNVYTKLFKVEICKSVKFPEDCKINEDKYFCYAAASKAKRICMNDFPKYYYVRRVDSSSACEFNDKFFDAIKLVKRLCQDVKTNLPELNDYASVNQLITYMRIYKLMCMRKGLVKYPDEASEMYYFIKHFDKKLAKRLVPKKNYIRFLILRTSKSVFNIFVNTIDKK